MSAHRPTLGSQSIVRPFADQRVVIVGLARQGRALARFFCAQGASVVVTDLRSADQLHANGTFPDETSPDGPSMDGMSLEEMPSEVASLAGLPIEYVLGEHPFTLLDGCDLLCLSGGVPPETPLPQEARRRGIPLSNDSLLTLRLSAAPVVGITGSSGKTTTTTLVGEMLRAAGQSTWVGGNIGIPLIDRVFEIDAGDRIVLELSSFQLQLFDASPQVSAVLNITPNHLDRHPSMAHYTASKANIVRYQSATDVAVLGVDNPITGRWWREGRVEIKTDAGQSMFRSALQAQRLGFSLVQEMPKGAFLRRDCLVWRGEEQEAEICSVGELQLLGKHNVANVLAACAISGPAGATPEAMRKVATTFAGVSHRLEWVRDLRGVPWYNDSIATTPERVVAALESFDAPLVLLAGGRDKHLPWQKMADLALQRARHLVLFGEAADVIAHEMQAAQRRSAGGAEVHVHRCCTLEQAIELAARVARPGDVVLLSPGGTSFDAYRDFEERGNHFRRLVQEL